jgi:magnesium-transporting ATPase (P-type)
MNQAEAAAAEPDHVVRQLGSSPQGLSTAEGQDRLRQQGPNSIGAQKRSLGKILGEQVRNGINLLLAGAGVLTIVTGDFVDGAIIVVLLLLTSCWPMCCRPSFGGCTPLMWAIPIPPDSLDWRRRWQADR